jgi:outer membrane lipopolysaccharide assembly protein LptE/RlpB
MSDKQATTYTSNIKTFLSLSAATTLAGIQWIFRGGFVTPAMKNANVKINGSLCVQGEIQNEDLETTLTQLQSDYDQLKLDYDQLRLEVDSLMP